MGSVVSSVGNVLGKVGSSIGGILGSANDAVGSIMSGTSKYAPLIDLAGGVASAYGNYSSNKATAKAAKQAVQMADPFGPYRGQFANQLMALAQNPGSIVNTPGYQFRLNSGLDAVNRQASTRGLLRSGNRLVDLMNYGQNFASQEYDREMNRLAQLAGANIGSPSSAAQYNILAGNASNLGTRGLIGDISEILSRTARSSGGSSGMLGSQSAPYMMQGNFGLNLPGY